MSSARKPGHESGSADLADGTLIRQVSRSPKLIGQDSTYDSIAPPFMPTLRLPRHVLRPRRLSPELASFHDRVMKYLRKFRVPTRVQLGHLWNAVPVISLGESHDETAEIAQVISRVILNYAREGDLIGFESDSEKQTSVDTFLRNGTAALSNRGEEIRPVLLACRERKVDVVFMGDCPPPGGRTSDSWMFHKLSRRIGGQFSGRRMLLWTGKAHALMNHPGSYSEAFVYLVVNKIGRGKVALVNLISRKGKLALGIPRHRLLNINLSDVPPVLVPTAGSNSPFSTTKFYAYKAVATKSADYIGIV